MATEASWLSALGHGAANVSGYMAGNYVWNRYVPTSFKTSLAGKAARVLSRFIGRALPVPTASPIAQ